jgi:hypothetical protein
VPGYHRTSRRVQRQEQAAERRHPDRLAELDRRGEQPARVRGLRQRHPHQGVRHQRAEAERQRGPGDDQRQLQHNAASPARVQDERHPGVEPHLDDAHDLRHHRRRPRALDEPGGDEDPDPGRDAADERRDGKDEDAGEEQPAPPVQVTHPGAGNQRHRVADGVAGHHELEFGPRGVQRPADRRHRYVDDRDVSQATFVAFRRLAL